MCVRVISRKPWPVRVRVRVTQGLTLSNSPGVIETNGLSSSILLGQHKLNSCKMFIQIQFSGYCEFGIVAFSFQHKATSSVFE